MYWELGTEWKSRRRLLTPAFHFQILSSFLGTFNEQSRILVNDFKRAIDKSHEIDVSPFVVQTALDIICGNIFPGASTVYVTIKCTCNYKIGQKHRWESKCATAAKRHPTAMLFTGKKKSSFVSSSRLIVMKST